MVHIVERIAVRIVVRIAVLYTLLYTLLYALLCALLYTLLYTSLCTLLCTLLYTLLCVVPSVHLSRRYVRCAVLYYTKVRISMLTLHICHVFSSSVRVRRLIRYTILRSMLPF